VKYGSKTVLKDVSHVFPAGSSFAVFGQNGAGKTTILRTIAGIVRPYAGSVRVFGRLAGSVEAKGMVGYLPERPGVYERLSALQNMLFHAKLNGLEGSRAELRSMELLEAFGLGGVAHERVHTFSKGMKQRLALARTLLTNPPLLLLDEPTSGLDPEGSNLLVSMLRERLSEGSTLIVSTHNPYFARRVCGRALVVSEGRIASTGELESLLFERKVRVKLLEAVSSEALLAALGDGFDSRFSGDGEALSEFELPVDGAEEIAQLVERLVGAGLRVVGVEPVETLPRHDGGRES